MRPDDTVLDLGAGYGGFINSVIARRRIAVDIWDEMPRHVEPAIEAIVGEAHDIGALAAGSVDYAFASNLFEHLTQDQFTLALSALDHVLSPRGTLTILQPNYRYACREYFDDYTHRSVYTHLSLSDLLTAHGWTVTHVHPRFLPLTLKSRLPVSDMLIRAYLLSPIRPFAKQMLVDATRVRRIAAMWATALCFLGCEGVHPWAPLVRVDPIACFFALAGLALAVLALERPRLIYLAALSFVLSVFAKQTSFVTATAAFMVLLYYRPSTALRGMATSIALGSICLITLVRLTDGGILHHIILYNINRFDPSRLIPNFLDGTGPVDWPLILLDLAAFVWTLTHERATGGQRQAPAPVIIRRMLIAFVLLATLSLVTSAKYGSSSAYYMQWEAGLSIFAGLAHAHLWDEQILVRKIRNHEISAVLSDGDRGYRWFDDQFNPAIVDAMDEALPRKIHIGMRILHLPADQPEKTQQR